ncbi:hypothetical protein M413DRAFT_275052 [Hebeloma cylindrosporum]|uniref:DUF6533 domain-containing protein n=1 Tax=Hebeloma cylindrosporum TaxID=76867 RepID=A0A0C3BZK4_HEBCY|nr:hypothetical protein M413DRAFT_275052 [Hebeloma cylindrosporum h7]
MFEVGHGSLSSINFLGLLDPRAGPEVYYQNSKITFVKHAVTLGTLVLIIYDYLCTFDQEVEHVWLRPRSLGTYLFVLNRYLPVANLILAYIPLKVYMPASACRHVYITIAWINLTGICVAQIILYLRTIALWARNRWVLWSLVTLYLCTLAPCLVLAKIYTNSLHFGVGPPGSGAGCILLNSNPIIFLDYILLFISETTVVVLTLVRAYKHLRYSNSSWVHQLYERGFLFYFYLLGFTILNMLFPIFAPVPLRSIFTFTQMALHSMFCSRVVFVILSQQSRRDDADFDTRQQPTDGLNMTSMLDTYATRDEFLPPHRRRGSRYRGNPP